MDDEQERHAHFIFDGRRCRIRCRVVDDNIEISVVPLVWRTRELACDVLALGNSYGVDGVEYGLSSEQYIRTRCEPDNESLTSSECIWPVGQC
jgi:hypothetical protein